MASINYAAREISVKIVYYGPGLSGKTTNLQIIHRKVPQEFKSDMVSLATETDRTLFFDFLPLDLGKIKGFSTKFQLYTVPGQVYYNATRKLVLRGVDGVVFVADSAPDKVQENLESFQNLEENLAEYGYKRDNVPIIIQYNKRDLPNALTIEELQQLVNKYNLPWSEAVANKGKGVFDSLKLIGKIVIDYLNKKYSRGPKAPEPASAPVMEQKRPVNQDPFAQQPPMQYPGNPQNQYSNQNNFGAYNAPSGTMPSYPQQQPFSNQPVRNFPQQQTRPSVMPPRPQQQNPSMLSSPARMPSPRPPMPSNQYGGQNQGTAQQQQPGMNHMPPQFAPHPQQSIPSQNQNFNRAGQGQNMGSAVNNNPFAQPAQSKPPVQQQTQFQAPQQNQFELDPFDDHSTFEPKAQQATIQKNNDQTSNEYFDYGSIDLQPMTNQNNQQMNDESEIILEQNSLSQGNFNNESDNNSSFSQNQFGNSGKTDLDLEIEKYQREIEEKQKRTRVQPAQPANTNAPTQYPPQNQKVQGAHQPMPQQGQQFQTSANENDYDVYNMEMPTYTAQNQPPTQRQPAVGNDEADATMFFTSVDTEHQKRPVKKPVVNPRTTKDQQQQKGFLSKFFNRETP